MGPNYAVIAQVATPAVGTVGTVGTGAASGNSDWAWWLSLIVVPLLAAVIGGAIGHWLGERAERQRQDDARTAVRRAASVEVAGNIAAVAALLDDLTAPVGRLGPKPATPAVLGAIRLALRPPIRFRRDVWGVRLTEVVDAVTDDDRAALATVYERLQTLETLKDGMRRPWETLEGTINVDDADARRWQEFEAIANAVRDAGNPLNN